VKVKKEDENKMEWCEIIGGILADALLDGEIVKNADFEKAKEILAEELFVRLLVEDYPPPYDVKLIAD
jgi:hypothetical protein